MNEEHEWLSLDPDESVVWTGQPRVWRIVGTAAGAAVLSILALAGAVFVTTQVALDPAEFPVAPGLAVWGVAALIVASQVATVAWAYLKVDHTDYVLTDRRIYLKTGVLSETVTSVGVDRVQNTTLRKDITGNLFDYGTVAVSTAGSGGADLAVSDLDDPEAFRDALQAQVRAADERGAGEDGPAPTAGALDDATVEALLEEARQLRAVAERMEEHA
ncbi:PH domain-containing protein [Halosimplex pelagicum]|uniref:PH domain-containing protein n=1 Tax=Halosimplex pelagicum TaxID=869886 RepID=A0A7D5TSD4_9EURY|nr:PH domain-containing protein [Halosimplex pelagicum]QLH80454.1 PH domain-containing protein [Halosimplex pelagicum]